MVERISRVQNEFTWDFSDTENMLGDDCKLSRISKWMNVVYFNVYIVIVGHMYIIEIIIGTDLN